MALGPPSSIATFAAPPSSKRKGGGHGDDHAPSRAPVHRYAIRYVAELASGGGRYMRSRYRRRASPSPSPTAMTGTARRVPRGTSPAPPYNLSSGGRLGDRRSRSAGTTPVPLARASPPQCSSPLRVPPGTPPRLCPRRRLQGSSLQRVGGETPSTGTLLQALSWSLAAPPGMLPRVLPGPRDGTHRCTPCSRTPRTSPDVPLDVLPGALPGVPHPYLSKKFSHPSRDGPSIPRYDAPDPSHERVLLLPPAVTPDHHLPLSPSRALGTSWETPCASRSPLEPSTPRRRTAPGPSSGSRLHPEPRQRR